MAILTSRPFLRQNLRQNLSNKIIEYLTKKCNLEAKTTGVRQGLMPNVGACHHTPLHYAIMYGDKESITILLHAKAKIAAEDQDGDTALHLAVESRRGQDVMKLLIDNKVSLEAKNHNGQTPLIIAIKEKNQLAANYLLANKADVNARDNNGNTPLHYAVITNNCELVKILLKAKADINASNKNGNTPLHLAARNSCPPQLIELLTSKGASMNTPNNCGKTVAWLLQTKTGTPSFYTPNPDWVPMSKDTKSNTQQQNQTTVLKENHHEKGSDTKSNAQQQNQEITLKEELIKKITDYKNGRKKILEKHTRGFLFFKGFSRSQKLDAAKGLLNAIDGEPVDLTRHLGALRNGELGEKVRHFLKENNTIAICGENVNSIRGFVHALSRQNTEKSKNVAY